jgi:hypothetical protein
MELLNYADFIAAQKFKANPEKAALRNASVLLMSLTPPNKRNVRILTS